MAAPKFVQARRTSLKVAISAAETSEIVLKKLVDAYGNALAMSDFGDTLYLTLEPGTENEEIMKATDFDVAADGSVTINTGITRGLVAKSPYGSGGTASAHAAGSIVVASNNPQMYDAIIQYLNSLAIAGAADAGLATKGLVEIATAAEIDADEDFGSTGAYVAVTPISLSTSIYRTRLPSADEKSALAGAQGTPSSTNKFLTQDNLSAAGNDQTQTTQDSSSTVGEADTTGLRNKLTQSFTPTRTKIRGVNLYKSANTGTFVGTVTVALQANSSGSPSGSNLASKTFTNAEWLALDEGEIEVLFSSEYANLTPGSLYWIVITTSTSDTANHPNFGINTAGGYSGGSVKYFNTTDGWVAVANIDLYFETLEGRASAALKSDASGYLPDAFYDKDTLGFPYMVGALANTFRKTFLNIHLVFTLWTGSVSDSAVTDFENWVPTSSDITVSPHGIALAFGGTGDDCIYNSTGIFDEMGIDWSSDNVIIFDFNAKYISGAGVAKLGMYVDSELMDVGFAQDVDGAGFAIDNGVLYAYTTSSAGAGTQQKQSLAAFPITLTNWNNYRIVFDGGAGTVKYYVNGVLVHTCSSGAVPSSAVNIFMGFGRDTLNPVLFRVTAPYLSVELNP